MSHNVKCITITIDAAFPTYQKVSEAMALAHRAGVGSTIIGVGSGPAMDLAKALSAELSRGDDGKLILAPATLGGMYAASSPTTILLDTHEEMLLPSFGGFKAEIAYDGKYFAHTPLCSFNDVSLAHVAAALLTITLDLARVIDESGANDDKNKSAQMLSVASTFASVLQSATITTKDKVNLSEVQQELLQAILQLNALQTNEETIPQTLVNALLPTYFPQNHIFTYIASMLPGVCETLASSNGVVNEITQSITCTHNNEQYNLSHWAENITKDAGIPYMASMAFGTPDIKTLTDKIDAYVTLRGGNSNDDLYLMSTVLERSLNCS